EDPTEKRKLLTQFMAFALDMTPKQFQRTRRHFIWEVVPKTLLGKTIFHGNPAFEAYRKQWPSDLDYFGPSYDEDYATIAKIPVDKNAEARLLDIPSFARGDYSIAHKNFKWVLIRSHEEGEMPIGDPIFILRD